MIQLPQTAPLFPYTTLFRSLPEVNSGWVRMASATRFSGPSVASDTVRNARARPESEVDSSGAPQPSTSLSGLARAFRTVSRSEEHTSELQSQFHLVCRLLLE